MGEVAEQWQDRHNATYSTAAMEKEEEDRSAARATSFFWRFGGGTAVLLLAAGLLLGKRRRNGMDTGMARGTLSLFCRVRQWKGNFNAGGPGGRALTGVDKGREETTRWRRFLISGHD
jgi:hypothetical protein